MNSRPATLLLLALLGVLCAAVTTRAQDDFYFVNDGRLFRQQMVHRISGPPPRALPPLPVMPRVASIAINQSGVAYVNTGVDGAIYRTDGLTATRVYLHEGQVRQLAFGVSKDILYFSEVSTPIDKGVVPDGQIYALNLSTLRAERQNTIAQSTVDGNWWGAFTVDPSVGRILLGTFSGGIYELRGGLPVLFYRHAGVQIYGLGTENYNLYYATGGSRVYKLGRARIREVLLNLPGGRLTHVSYALFPLGKDVCELVANITGSGPDARYVDLFFPTLRGPNLYWVTWDTTRSSRRVRSGSFAYDVPRGIYWVRMDIRGTIAERLRIPEQTVDCTGARAEVSFRF